MADKPYPRVQSVQTLIRLIYEDGTVGAVTTEPVELPLDPMEPAIGVEVNQILTTVAGQGDVLMQLIKDSGPDVLYVRAKANPKTTCKVIRKASSLPGSQQTSEDDTNAREAGRRDG